MDPSTDRGPDPHLNLDGVRLSGGERRKLAIIAMLVAGGLALVIGGIAYGLPPAPVGPGVPEVVVGGSGRASITVEQDGTGAQAVTAALPHTIALDRGTSVVSVMVRPVGTERSIACSVQDAKGAVLDESRGTGVVRCDAQLR